MKVKIWKDKSGKLNRVFLQDGMTNPKSGYVSNPPDVFSLDWDEIALDLHNQLVSRGLFSLADIRGNELTGAIVGAIRKKVKELYRRENVRSI